MSATKNINMRQRPSRKAGRRLILSAACLAICLFVFYHKTVKLAKPGVNNSQATHYYTPRFAVGMDFCFSRWPLQTVHSSQPFSSDTPIIKRPDPAS